MRNKHFKIIYLSTIFLCFLTTFSAALSSSANLKTNPYKSSNLSQPAAPQTPEVEIYYTGPGNNTLYAAALCLQGSGTVSGASECVDINVANSMKSKQFLGTFHGPLGPITFTINPACPNCCPLCSPPFTEGFNYSCSHKEIPLNKGEKILKTLTFHLKFDGQNGSCHLSIQYD